MEKYQNTLFVFKLFHHSKWEKDENEFKGQVCFQMRFDNGLYCHWITAIMNCQDGSYSLQTLRNTDVTIIQSVSQILSYNFMLLQQSDSRHLSLCITLLRFDQSRSKFVISLHNDSKCLSCAQLETCFPEQWNPLLSIINVWERNTKINV